MKKRIALLAAEVEDETGGRPSHGQDAPLPWAGKNAVTPGPTSWAGRAPISELSEMVRRLSTAALLVNPGGQRGSPRSWTSPSAQAWRPCGEARGLRTGCFGAPFAKARQLHETGLAHPTRRRHVPQHRVRDQLRGRDDEPILPECSHPAPSDRARRRFGGAWDVSDALASRAPCVAGPLRLGPCVSDALAPRSNSSDGRSGSTPSRLGGGTCEAESDRPGRKRGLARLGGRRSHGVRRAPRPGEQAVLAGAEQRRRRTGQLRPRRQGWRAAQAAAFLPGEGQVVGLGTEVEAA